MLETLKARKAQLEAQGKKGFTLMEMLIVIAIIAILIAIAIPLFTNQLNAARVATDEANIRSGYAVVNAKVLTDKVTTDKTYYLNSDATVTEDESGSYTTQGDTGTTSVTIGSSSLSWKSGAHVSYAYNATDNTITITTIAAQTTPTS